MSNKETNIESLQNQITSNAYWDVIQKSDEFLLALKKNDVTFKKLKNTVFGNTAIKVVRAIRKGGQACFDDVVKSHQIWWCTKHSICQVLQEHYMYIKNRN